MEDEIHPESLEKEITHIIGEARMVLPGIQALFGFQLIAVFNQRFWTTLDRSLQILHLISLTLVAISIALIMAPAAYHRRVESGSISRYLINYASKLISRAMLPLLTAIALDVGVVAYAITLNIVVSSLLGVLLFLFYAWFWFIFPEICRRKRR